MRDVATPDFTFNHATAGANGGSEVVVHDAARGLLYVLGTNGVDALRVSDGSLAFSVLASAVQVPGGGAAATLGGGNSVAVHGDKLAIAFNGPAAGQNGFVALFDLDAAGTGATWAATAEVGVVPDMITFTPDGAQLLVAIEAEPTQGYSFDAPGGLTVIDTATGTPTFYGFGAFDAQAAALRAAGVKLNTAIPGSPGANAALPSLDLEPEYITIAPDGTRAFVTLQENNAIGVFNLDASAGPIGWTAILPLGLSNHSLAGNGIDPSDRDGGAHIRQAPVFGLYQPDAIASFEMGGKTYLVTANEGDGREYGGAFNEEVRVSELLSGSTGNVAAAGMPALDPALNALLRAGNNALLNNAELGRLQVSRWSGDTDGDGDLDQLHAIGGRSFSIWEVGGTAAAPTLTQTFNSGSFIDNTVAALLPGSYDDARSDNKGAEPEHVTLGVIDGELHAFIGLERANANMLFRIDGPGEVVFRGFVNNAGDVAPETSVFIPVPSIAAPQGVAAPAAPQLAVANEVSQTTTTYDITADGTPGERFTLQILHASDFEAGLLATGRAKQFAAIVDRLEDTYTNSITLSSGDNFIPGPFAAAGTDASVVPVLRAFYEQLLGLTPGTLSSLNGSTSPFFASDIAILNAIGIQASVLGNHEFDLGTNPLAAAIDFAANTTAGTPGGRVTNIGAQFPYLSANLNFAGDANLNPLFTTTLRDAASYATRAADLASNNDVASEAADRQIAPWTVIHENGEQIGVLGVTTQILGQISTVDGVRVLDPAGDGAQNNVVELAQILQPLVDQMTALGLDKIILLSHLQQFQFELDLAPLLRGVDVIIGGGSNAVFANPDDALRPGDTAASPYPTFRVGADGNPVAVVNTGGEYSYVGRLVVEFDENGVIIPESADPAVNGPIATTDENVEALWGNADPYAAGTRGGQVKQLTDAVQAVIAAQDGNVFGFTEVFLEGRRSEVRTEETNLGNLTADANLFVARQVDPTVMLSIKNGGGIRAEIGTIQGQPIPEELPPQANPISGKPEGGVSQLDIANSLRFNNSLTKLSVTAANLERIFEHAVAATTPTGTPGQFPQIGGAAFSFDPTRASQILVAVDTNGDAVNDSLSDTASGAQVGARIRSLALYNDDGSVADIIVQDGVFQGDPNRVISLVTLNFLANPGSNPLLGGDSYPFPAFTIPGSRLDLLNNAALGDGASTFAAKGSEQDALAEFLKAKHGTQAAAFDNLDTTRAEDVRIQHLGFRDDTVGDPFAQVTIGERVDLVQMTPESGLFQFSFAGTDASETIRTHANDERVTAGGGNDRVFVGDGADEARGGRGNDLLDGGKGADNLFGEAGNDTLLGGEGNDLLRGGGGNDRMEGGLGDDIYFVGEAGDVVVELAGGGYDRVRASISHTLADNVEELQMQVAGTSGTGNAANNRIRGSDGSDTIDGGAGNDRIIAGGGADELTGGAGRDIFLFGAFADSAPTDSDLITDFTRGQDRMDVRAVDAFAFVGTGDFTGGGQASIRYEFSGSETLVQLDAGDGGAAEMVIRLTGNLALTGSDFLL